MVSQTPNRKTNTNAPSGGFDMGAFSVPDSLHDEAAVLASMVMQPKVIPEVVEILPSETYLTELRHRLLWRMILRLDRDNAGQGIDGLLLRDEIETCKEFGDNGLDYLREILNAVPTTANAVWYARKVREKAFRRGLIVAGQRLVELAAEPGDMPTLLDEAETALAQAGALAAVAEPVVDAMTALKRAYERIETKPSPKVIVPYESLAEVMPGFTPGQMVVIAARPMQGKTALALSLLARNFAKDPDFGAMFVSLEMDEIDLGMRLMSQASRIPYTTLARSGAVLSPDEWRRLNDANSVIAGWNFLSASHIPPQPAAIRHAVRRVHRRRPLNVVVVDYLQRLYLPAAKSNRNDEITAISNAMKNLAMELDIPVIVLSQLSRAPDARDDHRPRLSDCRDSGTIEQDADAIWLLYRADCYEPDPGRHTHDAEVHIGKQRNGPTGTAHLRFCPDVMSFENPCSEMLA